MSAKFHDESEPTTAPRQRRALDFDAIEAAALAAPAGPWYEARRGGPRGDIINPYGAVVSDHPTGIDDDVNVAGYGGHLVGESMPLSTRRFLVAASPDVVLDLVALARRAVL